MKKHPGLKFPIGIAVALASVVLTDAGCQPCASHYQQMVTDQDTQTCEATGLVEVGFPATVCSWDGGEIGVSSVPARYQLMIDPPFFPFVPFNSTLDLLDWHETVISGTIFEAGNITNVLTLQSGTIGRNGTADNWDGSIQLIFVHADGSPIQVNAHRTFRGHSKEYCNPASD